MVHGNYYGVQYEIYINKELDLFNDILPICINVRKMISLEKVDKNSEQYKLVIIPYRELNERFEKKEQVRKYMQSLDEISYNHQFTRKTHPDLFKYYDVKIYKTYIKHSKEIDEPCTEEMFENLEKKLEELLRKYDEDDFWDKSKQELDEFGIEVGILKDILKIQRIIRNKDYFEEIKEIERELTNIELTDGEKEIINKVINHPKLEGAIDFYGINLIEGFF